MDDHHIAGIHAALTALSVDVGRLSERLIALDAKLVNHTENEHQEFKEALALVSEIKKDLAEINNVMYQHRGAWFALAKIGAIILGFTALLGAIWEIITHRGGA